MQDEGHYWKYRVFREPPVFDHKLGHPVEMEAQYLSSVREPDGLETWDPVEEVKGNFFVLRPDDDHHARVAMAAYAFSCRQERPILATDILHILQQIDYEDEVGPEPDEADDNDPSTWGENVVEFIRGGFKK